MEDQPPSPSTSPPRSPTASSLHNNKPITITASSISYTKGSLSTSLLLIKSACTSSPDPIYILKDISFIAQPSQILALVGSKRGWQVHPPRHRSRQDHSNRRLPLSKQRSSSTILLPQTVLLRPTT
ncbi:unnamed protein product [Rhodiola kirilowii]